MNERIRELAQVAEQLADDELAHLERVHNRLYSFTESREIYNQKFAELIVQECLKKVEEEYKPVLEDKEMMKDTHWDGYVQCGVDSYVAIREHFFGVEE
jgi:hypothetical protein